jgi:hypothetical protein
MIKKIHAGSGAETPFNVGSEAEKNNSGSPTLVAPQLFLRDISWPPYLKLTGGKLLKFSQLFCMLLAQDGVMMAQSRQLRGSLIQLLLQLCGPLVRDLAVGELRNVSGVSSCLSRN